MSPVKKILFFLFLASLLTMMQGIAQNRYDWSQKRYTVTIQPMQLLFKNSLRFDFEMRITEGPGWLQFGPAIYYSNRRDEHYYMGGYSHSYGYGLQYNDPFTRLLGGGMDVNYKLFLDDKRSTYFLSGLSIAHFNITYCGSELHQFIEDELHYIGYMPSNELCQRITRPGVNFLMGFQVPSRYAFLFDMFGGFSYRYSISDKNKPSFGRSSFSFGFTGWVFVTGIRVGIGIK